MNRIEKTLRAALDAYGPDETFEVLTSRQQELLQKAGISKWDPFGALVAFGEDEGWDYFHHFDSAYIRWVRSKEDFARDHAHETGVVDTTAQWPNNYIDWVAAARGLEYDFNFVDAPDGGVYVFYRNW